MINQVMPRGASVVNLSYRSRQKQRLKQIKSIVFLLLVIIIVHYFWTNMQLPAEQQIYQPIVVQSGDTLWGLAENTGIHMDTRRLVLKIMNYNSLVNSTIRPGQTIYLPSLTSTLASN